MSEMWNRHPKLEIYENAMSNQFRRIFQKYLIGEKPRQQVKSFRWPAIEIKGHCVRVNHWVTVLKLDHKDCCWSGAGEKNHFRTIIIGMPIKPV